MIRTHRPHNHWSVVERKEKWGKKGEKTLDTDPKGNFQHKSSVMKSKGRDGTFQRYTRNRSAGLMISNMRTWTFLCLSVPVYQPKMSRILLLAFLDHFFPVLRNTFTSPITTTAPCVFKWRECRTKPGNTRNERLQQTNLSLQLLLWQPSN